MQLLQGNANSTSGPQSLQLREYCDVRHEAKSAGPQLIQIKARGVSLKRSAADRRVLYRVSPDLIATLPSRHATSLQALEQLEDGDPERSIEIG